VTFIRSSCQQQFATDIFSALFICKKNFHLLVLHKAHWSSVQEHCAVASKHHTMMMRAILTAVRKVMGLLTVRRTNLGTTHRIPATQP